MAKVKAGAELFYDDDAFSFTAMGTKEVISLYFSADTYEDNDGELLSTYKLESDALGFTVAIPAAAAEDIYNALGCVLDK